MASATSRALKGCFFVFNIIFGILGLACFALGVYLKFWAQPTDGELASFNTIVYMLIFVGFFTILVSILGCISAAVENICLLTLYFLITFLIFVLFITVGIFAFQEASSETDERSKLTNAVKTYYTNQTSQNYTDQHQQNNTCCGAYHGDRDYLESNQTVPTSCFPFPPPSNSTTGTVSAYPSCLDADKGKGYFATTGGITLGFAIIALVCMIVSLLFCCDIRSAE